MTDKDKKDLGVETGKPSKPRPFGSGGTPEPPTPPPPPADPEPIGP